MRPYCVGLTGGAGSGKSSVANLFQRFGVVVVDTDQIAHGLTTAGGAAMPAIVAAFGAEYLDEDGALKRPALRAHVFADSVARQQLEDILHPLIRAEASRQMSLAKTPYVVLVVPLLAEHLPDYRALVDRILLVDCDESQQYQRLLTRPTLSPDQAKAIMAAQISRMARLAIADDVIDNRGNMDALPARVADLHARYMQLASGKKPEIPHDTLH